MKKWQCTVCGYIHEGDEPPEECPVCGADRSQFVEIEPEELSKTSTEPTDSENKTTAEKADITSPPGKYDKLLNQMIKHHVHPVSVHIPNGVLPVSVIFIFLAALFNLSGLSQAAFYNLCFVVISLPLVLFSGYIEWQKKYGGRLTSFFITKITCAAVVSLTAITLAVWLFVNPRVPTTSPDKWLFVFVNFVMLAAAAMAGFLGGKLVFKD